MNERESIQFCHAPSKAYLRLLEECAGDPRSVAGYYAIRKAGSLSERGWQPDWDCRLLTKEKINGSSRKII